ncbi:MAG: MBL fold metallo-hydrolase [Candidatus Altiarchaeota archaeon]|nr:MBL fold metallo-hydrolase [Candidatus Altiarchaeota archaeon]
MASITFLGTGGGRFVVLSQRRYSGGIWLDLESRILLDPGPGALIRALEFNMKPEKLDAIFVSHRHLDHYSDAEVMVEAMTHGTKKRRGSLVIEKNTLPYISEYHQKAVDVSSPKPGDEFWIKELGVQAIPTAGHVDSLGFRFHSKHGTVTYSSDTDLDESLIRYYKNTRVLILNCIFPSGKEIRTHLNVDKAIEIALKAKPELLVLTHFGMQMLNSDPGREAKRVEKETGVKTVAARDGMNLDLDNLSGERREQAKLF